MSIGKSRNSSIDIDGLMNEIETDHQKNAEMYAADKKIEELKAAKADLQEAAETLKKATTILNEAIVALKSATDCSNNIVSGIDKAIADVQENTKFNVHIEREDMEQLMKNSEAVLTTDEIVMKRHFDQQVKAMEAHERKISAILNRNQGFWVSDFWAKVAGAVILIYTIVVAIYVLVKT